MMQRDPKPSPKLRFDHCVVVIGDQQHEGVKAFISFLERYGHDVRVPTGSPFGGQDCLASALESEATYGFVCLTDDDEPSEYSALMSHSTAFGGPLKAVPVHFGGATPALLQGIRGVKLSSGIADQELEHLLRSMKGRPDTRQ